jgi:lipid A ethanolaminephosphotransferase
MGNHGPAYYKRYRKEFEKFKPICATNQLEECKKESIANAYDNAILYTDYFLSQTINFLKRYDATHKTAMIYMSDHGESLGESGVYLHGLPYFIAPEAQTHVASLMWFSEEMEKSLQSQKIKDSADKSYSHDNLFHSLLGIFNVQTEVYNKELDIFN